MNPKKLFPFLFGIIVLVIAQLFLAACSSLSEGTIHRGIPDYGNGTPAETGAQAGTAFVRNNQLFLSHQGRYTQATHFDFSQLPTVFWQTPRWSSDGHTLAFIVAPQSPGAGGGGCPGPDYRSGGLYVLDSATGQMERVLLPDIRAALEGEHVDLQTRAPRDHWQAAFWEDATHLLAWYTTDGTEGGNKNTGLYRYELQSHKLEQILTPEALGVHLDTNQPRLLSLRYSSGQLFYQVVVHDTDTRSRLAIYSHPITSPETPGTQLWDLGTEASWCGGQKQTDSASRGAYVFPGWDVSADGKRLVAQTMNGTVQVLNIQDRSTVEVFSQVASTLSGHDILVTWGPDSRTLALSNTPYALGETAVKDGPFTTSLPQGSTTPTDVRSYTPHLGGEITWRADSTLFALHSSTLSEQTGTALQITYGYQIDKTQGQILVKDAHAFSFATTPR